MKRYTVKQIKDFVADIPDDTKWQDYMTKKHAEKHSNNWDLMIEKSASPKAWIFAILDKLDKENG